MIGRWGMSEEIGLLFTDDESDSPFLGRQMAGQRNYSEATAARVDEAARQLLEERMNTAVRLLNENRDALERLAMALLKHETLDRYGVEAAIRSEDVPPPDQTPPTRPNEPSADSKDKDERQSAPQPQPGMLPA
jgi:cell division protease FtsH